MLHVPARAACLAGVASLFYNHEGLRGAVVYSGGFLLPRHQGVSPRPCSGGIGNIRGAHARAGCSFGLIGNYGQTLLGPLAVVGPSSRSWHSW